VTFASEARGIVPVPKAAPVKVGCPVPKVDRAMVIVLVPKERKLRKRNPIPDSD
jgi:hypothetical protein